MAVDEEARYNVTSTLTGPTLNVPAGNDFILNFDIKLANGTDKDSTFTIFDATNENYMLQFCGIAGGNTWKINGSETATALDVTYKYSSTSRNLRNTLTWFTVTLQQVSNEGSVTTTSLTIKNKETGEIVFTNSSLAVSSTGGLGKMSFAFARAWANFAIDNICVYGN